MRIEVSFPRCTNCGQESAFSYHENCDSGGKQPLEIDTSTNQVYCPSCRRHWRIWDSTYHCLNCGTIMKAKDIVGEVNYILALSKVLADRIQRDRSVQQEISRLSKTSFIEFIADGLHEIGIIAGYTSALVSKIIAGLKRLFIA